MIGVRSQILAARAGFHEHHWHGTDARVVVLQGTLKVSFGETFDLEYLKAYHVGTHLFVTLT